MAMKSRLSWCLLGCAFIVLGCRSTAKRSPDMASELATADVPASDVPAAPWETLFELRLG